MVLVKGEEKEMEIEPNPVIIDLFPTLVHDLLAESLIKNGAWTQRTDYGWLISGVGVDDSEFSKVMISLLLREDRLTFNLVIYCLWEMGEKIFNEIRNELYSRFKSALDFYGMDRLFHNSNRMLWLIGKLNISQAKDELESIYKKAKNPNNRFEAGIALVRIERDINGVYLNELKQLVKKKNYIKWSDKVNHLEEEIKRKIQNGISSHHSSVLLVRQTAFISYTGKGEIVEYVKKLGTHLLNNGINVHLDCWDVDFGERFTKFMNKIEKVNYTLMIFTTKYIEKLESESGGVSYEIKIIDSLIANGIPDRRIVTILKERKIQKQIPARFSSKKYCDFSTKVRYRKNIDDLVNHILERKEKKPPLKPEPSA